MLFHVNFAEYQSTNIMQMRAFKGILLNFLPILREFGSAIRGLIRGFLIKELHYLSVSVVSVWRVT